MVITLKDHNAAMTNTIMLLFVHVCVLEKKSDGITLVMWDQMCSVCLLCVSGRDWSQSQCGISVRISEHLQQL